MSSSEIRLSVVVPAYNEEERIGDTLETVVAYLSRQSYAWEIIVVDDGSRDHTASAAERRLAAYPHLVIRNPLNKGKGAAVRRGILRARGEIVLFTDADLSTPIEETEKFLAAIEKGYDIVIGSRALPDSDVEVRQNLLREMMGKIFNRIARTLAFKGIKDSQCGFKCFRRAAARDVFGRQQLDGFSFDVEVLHLAQRLDYKILEAPVVWRNSPKSRVRLYRDPLFMLRDVLLIRLIHWGL